MIEIIILIALIFFGIFARFLIFEAAGQSAVDGHYWQLVSKIFKRQKHLPINLEGKYLLENDEDDQVSFDFQVPRDMIDEEEIPNRQCLGRWVAEAQIAEDQYRNPSLIPANHIVFSEDLFAVMFLGSDFNDIALYHRIRM